MDINLTFMSHENFAGLCFDFAETSRLHEGLHIQGALLPRVVPKRPA